ncbi:hypothetical protein MTBUT4_330010 [Magnetospirillum sp. UT-4]|nr:hypothetical protein MTBUT4_330010 [Magnetospirillum sp. UT-4]
MAVVGDQAAVEIGHHLERVGLELALEDLDPPFGLLLQPGAVLGIEIGPLLGGAGLVILAPAAGLAQEDAVADDLLHHHLVLLQAARELRLGERRRRHGAQQEKEEEGGADRMRHWTTMRVGSRPLWAPVLAKGTGNLPRRNAFP